MQKADSLFAAYTALQPDSILGHYWRGRVNGTLDTTFTQEPYVTNMVNSYSKALDLALLDKIRYKSLGITSSLALIGYFNNIKSDKEAALVYAMRGFELDTSNAQIKSIIDYLKKPVTPVKQPATPKQKTPVKATGTKTAATKPVVKKPVTKKPGTAKAKSKTTAVIITDVATI
jgi:hypothetical protein